MLLIKLGFHYGHIFRIIKRVIVSVFSAHKQYYLLPLCKFAFPGASVPSVQPLTPLLFNKLTMPGREKSLAQSRTKSTLPPVSYASPSRQADKPLPSILSLIFLVSPYFKEHELHSVHFCQALGNIFLNFPEITDAWQNRGDQGTLVLFLVGTI